MPLWDTVFLMVPREGRQVQRTRPLELVHAIMPLFSPSLIHWLSTHCGLDPRDQEDPGKVPALQELPVQYPGC